MINKRVHSQQTPNGAHVQGNIASQRTNNSFLTYNQYFVYSHYNHDTQGKHTYV